MTSRVRDWLDERTGYRHLVRAIRDEPVPGGPSWAYVFGSTLLALLALQAVTGVLLATVYSPSSSDAWASVGYLQDRLAFGWFIRGLHHHGASAMVVLSCAHLLQTALYGAYRRPRELNWIAGVALLGLVLAFALTGYLLPWDQKGYWSTKVATGLAGGLPLVGPWLQRFIQGGNEYGNLTLTRFYALHVMVLPAAVALVLVAHLALFRRHGVTPRWGREPAELAAAARPFWPGQAARDGVAIGAVVMGIVAVTLATGGAPLGPPADPASSFDARPEWYFRPLFQLLRYAPGALEPVAALAAPLAALAFLIALPFVDRAVDRDPRLRRRSLGLLGAGALALAGLTAASLWEDADDAGLQSRLGASARRASKARALAAQGVPPAGGGSVYENDPHFRAERLFGERCAGCHRGGDRKGPLLDDGYGSRAWLRAFLRDPSGPDFFGPTKGLHRMKPVTLAAPELAAVVEMLYAEAGPPDVDRALAARGREVFEVTSCIDCHSVDWETVDDPGPNLGRRGTAAWLKELIGDPGHDRFFGELNEMPAFRVELTDEELGLLADYLVSLRDGRSGDRAP